jgi:hypothetical protein
MMDVALSTERALMKAITGNPGRCARAASGHMLACLDALAGDAVENSCEKALFATPEATASAVSYVAAQLSLLLAAGNERARRGDQSTLANLRRSVELDRFGIVAHVLVMRDGCTPAQCDAFALMHDASRVSLNMAGHTYDAE